MRPYIIESYHELKNWVDDHIANATAAEIELIADAIHNDPSHPKYGDDWRYFLIAQPDSLHELLEGET